MNALRRLTGSNKDQEYIKIIRNDLTKSRTDTNSDVKQEDKPEDKCDDKSQDNYSQPELKNGTLIVSRQPNTNCAYTNMVYLHPENNFAKYKYLQINNFIFEVETHENIVEGSIGLNGIHRKILDVDEFNIVAPLPWDDVRVPLHYIQLEIGFVKSIKGKEFIEEENLCESLKELMENKIFNVNQKFYFKPTRESPTTLVLTVKKMAKVEGNNNNIIDTKNINIGVLLRHTSIEFIIDDAIKSHIVYTPTRGKHEFLNPDWKFNSLGIGGLDKEFSIIFRRAFISRCLSENLLRELNIKHIRGVLLYGPPGTGKTLIARQISTLLKSVEPVIINGPEVMNSLVGKSEENIRKAFAQAKKDWAEKGEKSNLHVIIFDEIDAICKSRGTISSSGVYDAMVNQLLTEMDGVNTPNNFLAIGMTNRKDLLDPALLRPGRFEVHVEINLPDMKGRHEILEIHTKAIRENKRMDKDVDLWDIADRTKNYSGAELEAIVKCTTTLALSNLIKNDKNSVLTDMERNDKFNQVVINMDHFLIALEEIKPSFGAQYEDLLLRIPYGIILFNEKMKDLYETTMNIINKFKDDNNPDNTFSILLHGQIGCGKTALSAKFALKSQYPYIKIISPDNYIGYSEQTKSLSISKIFDDAYKTPISMIILDDIEKLFEYVPIGPRFSNQVLQTLNALINKIHPVPNRRLLIIVTTNNLPLLQELQMDQYFNSIYEIPNLYHRGDFEHALMEIGYDKVSQIVMETLENDWATEITIKKFLNKVNIMRRLQ